MSRPAGPVARLLALEQRHADLEFAEIRDKILAGEPGAWRLFVERYSCLVYTVALRLAGARDEKDREDVAHEVYLGLFDRLARDRFHLLRDFRGECRFETYLFSAVRNELAELRRRRARERHRFLPYEEDGTAESAAAPAGARSDPTQLVESIGLDRKRVTELVARALAKLEPAERLVLHLRFQQGLPLRRLAELFQWKDTNAAAYELSKALRKLELLERCRSSLRWGEPEREEMRNCLKRWLESGSGPPAEPLPSTDRSVADDL